MTQTTPPNSPQDPYSSDPFDPQTDLLDQDLEDTLYGAPDPRHQKEGGNSAFVLLGLLAAVIGLFFLFSDGLSSETYFYTVDQFVEKQSGLIGETVRVKGIVQPGSVVTKDGHLETLFRLTEKGKSVAVRYDKALPDTFKENVEVVVRGTIAEHDLLIAQEVMVKCPSRYEGSPPGQHPGGIPMATS